MTVQEFINALELKSTGKLPTFASGSTKWNQDLALANFYVKTWLNEPGIDWASRYSPKYDIGSVTATDSFNIPSTIYKVSDESDDPIRIIHTDGRYTDYQTVDHDELKRYATGHYCSIINGQLVFNKSFTADDPQFGGDIKVPSYTNPDDLAAATDVIPVDDPNWLVLACAAEKARNDIVKQNQYPNLQAEANNAMEKMRENNSAQVRTVSKSQIVAGATW